MHVSRLAGVLLVSIATLAQQQPVPITSEPSHHMVIENQYVRVFDVTVGPKAATLVHQHDHDYLFVTLGDSDVISARTGAAPAELVLKDGETRFTPGSFSHAAINKSDKPFHNITIELLQPSSNVKTCTKDCEPQPCGGVCSSFETRISSDQWKVISASVLFGDALKLNESGPQLIVALSELRFSRDPKVPTGPNAIELAAGKYLWLEGQHVTFNNVRSQPARYITLQFTGRTR